MEAKKRRASPRIRLERAEQAFLEILIGATGNTMTIRKMRKLIGEHPKILDSRLYSRWIQVNRDKIIRFTQNERAKR
jgi:hypothetical protein